MSRLGNTALAALFILVTPCAGAADADAGDAIGWLTKMADAAHRLDYDGTFVYRSNGQMQSLRILHSASAKGERERLVSLNGPPREVIRNGNRVACLLPGHDGAIVRKAAGAGTLPLRLPSEIPELQRYYHIRLAGSERVTSRVARKIEIRPVDQYRYGHNYWVDQDTGLLLHAELLNTHGRVIEELLFTSLSVGGPIPVTALEPQHEAEQYAWQEDEAAESNPADDADDKVNWKVEPLPPGFRETAHRRLNRTTGTAVEHMIFSDGLASLSVFVEPSASGGGHLGSSHFGALNAEIGRVGDHRVTAIGDVPSETLQWVLAHVKQAAGG